MKSPLELAKDVLYELSLKYSDSLSDMISEAVEENSLDTDTSEGEDLTDEIYLEIDNILK